MTRMAKLEFPRFAGEKVQEWLFKANQFFYLDHTAEEVKVSIASIHMDGAAATWHQSLVQSPLTAAILNDWNEYQRLVEERFGEVMDDPIAELKQLQETEGIVEYHEKFEMIRARINLPEEYLLSAYLAGLRTDTQMQVRMFQPTSVRQCLVLGRLYEKAHPAKPKFNSWSNTNKGGPYTKTNNGTQRWTADTRLQDSKPVERRTQPKRFLSTEEMNKRRAQGLCYFCDEKYTPEHYLKHKNNQLYFLEMEGSDDQVEGEEVTAEPGQENVAQISLNALAGISDHRTMRIKGVHGKNTLYVLIDSGSTHNFIDCGMAEKLGCINTTVTNMTVKVADGRKIGVTSKIQGLEWMFQGVTFKADVMSIPLSGCDMVLGCQWLETLGPITWDFKKLEMRFYVEGKSLLLKGLNNNLIKPINASRYKKITEQQVQLSMIHIQDHKQEDPIWRCSQRITDEEYEYFTELQALLKEYQGLFEEPSELPPFRGAHDHRITLKEGSNPTNQRPYRYATQQKNEIDRMVEELLKAGTIQDSSSPFASPVVLVKKKDGSWRLCVDYRSLNGMTVKDRYPIPLIEDLMDELGGLGFTPR